MKFRVKKFVATLSFLSKRRLQVVLDGKYSQEYPINAGVPKFIYQFNFLNQFGFILWVKAETWMVTYLKFVKNHKF